MCVEGLPGLAEPGRWRGQPSAGSLTGTQEVAGTVEGPASSALDRDGESETQTGRKGGGQPSALGSRAPAATVPRAWQAGSRNPHFTSAEIGGFLKHSNSEWEGALKEHCRKPFHAVANLTTRACAHECGIEPGCVAGWF